MKVAKLVYVTLLTRVIVEENADQQSIMEEAVPKLSENLMVSPLENIDKIVYDTECPYQLGEEYHLSVGDNVEMPDPKDDGTDSWNHEFTGQIYHIQEVDGIMYAVVEDGDNEYFEIEAERLIGKVI
jgi:hypothetical protein